MKSSMIVVIKEETVYFSDSAVILQYNNKNKGNYIMSYMSALQAILLCAIIIVFLVAIAFIPTIPAILGMVGSTVLTVSIR